MTSLVVAIRHRRALAAGALAMAAALCAPLLVVLIVVVGPPPAEDAPGGGSTPVEAEGSNLIVDGIAVDASIGPSLRGLLDEAADAGIHLSGSGWRSADSQVALRRSHCGTSAYAIWDMPSDECRPPTARPGSSMHERGLAIDFRCAGLLVRREDGCFGWLVDNAAAYGFFNLPSEPWHWSVNGR